MPDDDQIKVEEGERPQAAVRRKTPIRGRAARNRSALHDLAFFIFTALSSQARPEVQLQMLRVKLLAWAAIYGAGGFRGKPTDQP